MFGFFSYCHIGRAKNANNLFQKMESVFDEFQRLKRHKNFVISAFFNDLCFFSSQKM